VNGSPTRAADRMYVSPSRRNSSTSGRSTGTRTAGAGAVPAACRRRRTVCPSSWTAPSRATAVSARLDRTIQPVRPVPAPPAIRARSTKSPCIRRPARWVPVRVRTSYSCRASSYVAVPAPSPTWACPSNAPRGRSWAAADDPPPTCRTRRPERSIIFVGSEQIMGTSGDLARGKAGGADCTTDTEQRRSGALRPLGDIWLRMRVACDRPARTARAGLGRGSGRREREIDRSGPRQAPIACVTTQ